MWNNILGHEQQKKFLQRYLQAKERPHALLFLGAEGLGKKQLALAFAKTLLCPQHSGEDGCESCRLLNLEDGNLSHPDFLLLKREADEKTGRLKDIGIDQIRDLTGKAAFAPVMSDRKVLVLEDADRMTVPAANSFLKLLEEPPAGWVIIMLATQEDKLLSTILSRVVCLRFAPVPVALVEQELVRRGLAAEQATVLARISEGSVGLAVSLAERQVFEMRKQAVAFLEALPLQTPMNYLAGRVWQQKGFERQPALLLCQLLQLLLRDLLMLKLRTGNPCYNQDLATNLAEQSRNWSVKSLHEALAAVQDAFWNLENNVGVRMALEAMALKIDNAYKE
ncbi:ATP-binding protein [Phascolarctobacterium sp.]|uniref:DNA polymerase III subunit n=1 Tax=Phascolarctobacterium sp. TaxID=2049039 RepID=UPI00386FEEBD